MLHVMAIAIAMISHVGILHMLIVHPTIRRSQSSSGHGAPQEGAPCSTSLVMCHLVQNGISDQTRNGTAMMYSAHTRIFTSLFWTKLSGSREPMSPKSGLATRHVAVQPYQYMAGPSPLRAAAQKRSTRLVPGW